VVKDIETGENFFEITEHGEQNSSARRKRRLKPALLEVQPIKRQDIRNPVCHLQKLMLFWN
jgi:hypothetical protein